MIHPKHAHQVSHSLREKMLELILDQTDHKVYETTVEDEDGSRLLVTCQRVPLVQVNQPVAEQQTAST